MDDRLARDWTAPPSDALAEAVVLQGVLNSPEQLDRYDPAPFLVYPEHRQVLKVIKRARASTLGQSWGYFYCAWIDECQRIEPVHWRELIDTIDHVRDDLSRYEWREYDNSRSDEPDIRDHRHSFVWWYDRLKEIAECRRIIHESQGVVEPAWYGDVVGARRKLLEAADRIRSSAEPIRIDV